MRSAKIPLAVAMLGLAAMCSALPAQEASALQTTEQIREYEQVVQGAARSDGNAWWKLAMLYQDAARFGDAEQAYRRALELMKSGDRVSLANMMDCMGTMYVQMGRFADAEELERKALAIRQEKNDLLGVGLSWMHLAMLSLGKRESADGEMYAELAVEKLIPDKGQSAATVEQKMTALTYLALARCAAHECKDAMTPLKRASTIAKESYSERSFPVAYIRFLEGYVDWKRGHKPAAASLMKSGTEAMEVQLGWEHPTFISAMEQYEGFLVETRRNAEAMKLHEEIAKHQGTEVLASTAKAGVLPR